VVVNLRHCAARRRVASNHTGATFHIFNRARKNTSRGCPYLCLLHPLLAVRTGLAIRLHKELGFDCFVVSRELNLGFGRLFCLCIVSQEASASGFVSETPNQSMKPTAPPRNTFTVFATTPWISCRCPASLVRFASWRSHTPAVMLFNASRGLSLSRWANNDDYGVARDALVAASTIRAERR
jgi:hypothetical protein